MKIETWIKYEESFIPPRCRKLRYKECEEHVQITLTEAKMSNLQPAFEDCSYDGAGMIYFYKGRLWAMTKMCHVCAGGEDEHGYHTPLEALIWWRAHGSAYFRSDYDREYRGMDTSKEAVLVQARADMCKYLLVDGVLYNEVCEPRYCIYTFGLGHNHGGTALSVDYGYNPNISKQRYFSALQGKEAILEAGRIARERGDTESVSRFSQDIKVFMPELVKVMPQVQHGTGNPLLNKLDSLIAAAPDQLTAALLCIAEKNI